MKRYVKHMTYPVGFQSPYNEEVAIYPQADYRFGFEFQSPYNEEVAIMKSQELVTIIEERVSIPI